jgi:hypothetical protein
MCTSSAADVPVILPGSKSIFTKRFQFRGRSNKKRGASLTDKKIVYDTTTLILYRIMRKFASIFFKKTRLFYEKMLFLSQKSGKDTFQR